MRDGGAQAAGECIKPIDTMRYAVSRRRPRDGRSTISGEPQVRTTSGTRVLQAVTFGVFSQVQLGTAWVFGGVRSVWDGYIGLRGAHEQNQQLRQALSQVLVKLLE